MVIRGAPAIGAAAAYGLAVELYHNDSDDLETLKSAYAKADQVLRASRPTAVNLFWALDRVSDHVASAGCATAQDLKDCVLAEAHAIASEDVEICRQMGLNALELVPQGARAVHHCNTGGLATVGHGTALGVIKSAHEHGRNISVLVDETRPRLQGARLTSWELQQLGIPHKLIVDGASGYYMKRERWTFVWLAAIVSPPMAMQRIKSVPIIWRLLRMPTIFHFMWLDRLQRSIWLQRAVTTLKLKREWILK